MIRATIDTNVLVSALMYTGGKPYQLLQMALASDINLTVSQAIVDEVGEVLRRKFGATQDFIDESRQVIGAAARTVTPAVRLDVIKDDPDDNRILECAVTAGSDLIVTGDKDLLRIGRYDSIAIVTVADFMELVRER